MSDQLAYRIDDACRALGLGKTTLYALIGEGLIEARICGGRTLVLGESLRQFLASLPKAEIRMARKQHRTDIAA